MLTATRYRVPATGTHAIFPDPVHAETVAIVTPWGVDLTVTVIGKPGWMSKATDRLVTCVVRPFKDGWQCVEATGDNVVFESQVEAIDRAVQYCSTVGAALDYW